MEDWGPRQVLPPSINTGERELSPCESPDGKYLWFIRYNRAQGFDLYYSAWDTTAGTWATAVNAGPKFNSACHEWSVSISADNRRMFVAHDVRPGTVGCEGDVLWVSYWDGNLHWWDSLIWMGDVLNRSSANHQACMSLDTSLLWVASGNTWPGVQKCGSPPELVSVSYNPLLWDSIVNPGAPLNSCEEEGTVAVSADGNTLFFSSKRDTASGKLEIYFSQWQPKVGISAGDKPLRGGLQVLASPNPFNGVTTVSILSPVVSSGTVRVCDVLGRCVLLLYQGTVPAGETHITWDASRLASGVYFVIVDLAGTNAYRKVLYLK
jgi:hypothetical protein